jgi:predicted Rossmann fold flavoprotein
MMAAGRAAACGAPVLLLEKNDRLGIKLRITGNGRCNLTNETDLDGFVAHFGTNGRFLYRAFTRFFQADLRAFFAQHGVPTIVERGRRVFPASNDARQVVQALKDYLSENQVKIRYHVAVRRLLVQEQHIAGVETTEGEHILAPIVILATGGGSYPSTGSTGDGFRMAQEWPPCRSGATISDSSGRQRELGQRAAGPQLAQCTRLPVSE